MRTDLRKETLVYLNDAMFNALVASTMFHYNLCSPDSTALVFSGRLSPGSVNAAYGLHLGNQIVVVTVGAIPTTLVIAEGSLAFWSPR